MPGLLGALGLWVARAFAAPAFVAEVPDDARVAAEAWRAGVECTGREGRAHPRVELVRGAIRGDYLGLAHHDDQGLYRIELSAREDRLNEVIVHEVAHAWVMGGPPALVEGRTELLADCIVTRRPGLAPLQWDDGRDLAGLPDLRTWSNREDHGPAVLADQRTAAYLGAARLMRAAALIVDPQALWPEEELDWDGFRALLSRSPHGESLIAVLDGGAQAQRAALEDLDVDGLPAISEAILGTDPTRWDTDGDGWWDGSVLGVPARSVALPLDGTPVCSGLVGAHPNASAWVVTGGNLRGAGLPNARLLAGNQQGEQVPVRVGEPVLIALHGTVTDVTGGAWARVRGSGLEPDPACVTTPRLSVWASDPDLAPLVPEVVLRIEHAMSSAASRWGLVPGPVAVALGGSRTTYEGAVLYLSRRELERAMAAGALSELAALAVTIPQGWRSGVLDWRVGEALARALIRPPPRPGPR